MSSSSLWVMDKKFYGKEMVEFPNSWLFAPMSWDILMNKYLPPQYVPLGHEPIKSFIPASIFDKTIGSRLNEKINNSDIQEDRVLWELGSQQVFFTKDKDFVADAIDRFLKTNAAFADDLGEPIFVRYAEVSAAIRAIDGEEHPYFVMKNTSCDDGVEWWFVKYTDEDEENAVQPLSALEKRVTEFVFIENEKISGFKSNIDYFKENPELVEAKK